MLVGAEFFPQEDRDADISPSPLADYDPEELPGPQGLLSHELTCQFDEQLNSIRSDSTCDLVPVPPFFWDDSGRAAIHGPLTTAQKLFGESIFLDLVAMPRRAETILGWIVDATIALVKHYAQIADRQITEVHVGECSACMIGADAFSRFVVPAIRRIGEALGPIRLHSCGTSDHLLNRFTEIEALNSLDTGGGTSVSEVRRVFGAGFRLEIAPLVGDLLSPSCQPLIAWADRVIDQNHGGPLLIVYHLERGYDLDHLRALQEHLLGQCTQSRRLK
jgi:hypothetical protein